MRVEELPDQMAGDDASSREKQLDSPKQKRLEATHRTKLSKLTALLLAGVLTLLLLTACSGGGSSGPVAQAEADVMGAINNGRTVALANDDGMRTVANDRLDALELELKGDALGYKSFNKVVAKWDADNQNATLTLVAKYDYNDTTLQKIIDQIKGNDQNEALDFALNGNYTKAGVVARTIRGQTYVAISLRVGRNL